MPTAQHHPLRHPRTLGFRVPAPKSRRHDGTTVGVPRLHVYREGYGGRFAYEVPPGMLRNPDDPLQVLLDFLATYNIERNGIVDLPDAANQPLFV